MILMVTISMEEMGYLIPLKNELEKLNDNTSFC